MFGPVEVFIAVRKPAARVRHALRALSGAVAVLSAGAMVGSVYSFIHDAAHFKMFDV